MMHALTGSWLLLRVSVYALPVDQSDSVKMLKR